MHNYIKSYSVFIKWAKYIMPILAIILFSSIFIFGKEDALRSGNISIDNDNLLSVNIYAGSYLPQWRKNSNYIKSYSAFKNKGGGVELDLSHEIDYVTWLFGKFKISVFLIFSIVSKFNVSELKSFTIEDKSR